MTNGSPPPDPSAGVTKVFAGGIGSLTAAFGAVGAVTGGLERVFRDHPKATIVLLALTAVVVTFGIVGPAVTERIADGWLVVGTFFLVGIVFVVSALVVQSASTKERPSVSGSLSVTADQVTVKGLVEASGLKTNEHMLVKVEGAKTLGGKTDTVLYQARAGPNSGGTVKAPIETVVPRAAYAELVVSGQVPGEVSEKRTKDEDVQNCGETTRHWGCARLVVPRAPAKPK